MSLINIELDSLYFFTRHSCVFFNLKSIICNCEKCSVIMNDKGIIQEFFDKYITNMDISNNN